MKPAFSVLFLTTLIGAGQGLLVALVTGQWYFVIGATPRQENGAFYAVGAAIALVLLGLGLFASFFHLANPQRAWRAATRWRTSWLSREVILLPVVMGLGVVYAGVHGFGIRPVLMTFSNQKSLDLTMAVGFVTAGAALLLYVVTGMIYACVRFIREWASSWTVVNFVAMGLASGFTVAAAYAAISSSPLTEFFAADALVLTLVALATRSYQLWRNWRAKSPFTLKSAIGVHHPQIRQLTQGFCGTSFNTKEFFVPGGKGKMAVLTAAFVAFGFLLPAVMIGVGWATGDAALLIAAALAQYLGLLAERWVFFAQGNHVQNLYYQARA
ncbi:MAG: dimethyl sulfoxide reductase anchor subunit [Magnetospirillum sp.]|nr:dimethyl sulfoxide reductase anchor subunit [Magnetospirillum sp.]